MRYTLPHSAEIIDLWTTQVLPKCLQGSSSLGQDPRKGPWQVAQKADGVETLPTATELHSQPQLAGGLGRKQEGTDIY